MLACGVVLEVRSLMAYTSCFCSCSLFLAVAAVAVFAAVVVAVVGVVVVVAVSAGGKHCCMGMLRERSPVRPV